MRADLAVVHETALARVHELDRILDGDDVILPVLVRMVHDRRQRRGLAAAGRSGDQHEPLVEHRRLFQDRRQTEVVRGQDLRGDLPEHRADAIPLLEEIGAEARDAGDLVSEVDVAGLFEDLDLVLRRDLVEHRAQIVIFQRIVLDPFELAVQAHDRLLTGHQMEIRRALVEHELEERVDPGHAQSSTRTPGGRARSLDRACGRSRLDDDPCCTADRARCPAAVAVRSID